MVIKLVIKKLCEIIGYILEKNIYKLHYKK
jgi:hypothetical protein